MMRYAILFCICLTPLAPAQTGRHPPPVNPKDFAVMAWGNSPSEAEQLRGMREAELNVSGFCRAQDLEQVRAAGLTCFVRDPVIQRVDPMRLPPDAELRSGVDELSKRIAGNPAALGFYLRDEPNAQMMPGLGKLAGALREA